MISGFDPRGVSSEDFFPIMRLGWWNASLLVTVDYPYVDVIDVDVRWDNGLLPAGYAD